MPNSLNPQKKTTGRTGFSTFQKGTYGQPISTSLTPPQTVAVQECCHSPLHYQMAQCVVPAPTLRKAKLWQDHSSPSLHLTLPSPPRATPNPLTYSHSLRENRSQKQQVN